ncbi:F0F1 ATP synthase subunit B family protein [Entomobacter blattae]|uniref:ATP synthase subunit b n=1 Tax=Entomobacter blattae TaxID=2762277 RepID=A0A7H1NPR0_9PROT|nr:hypothetical protein [Entomobacter blattae]QNT77770.1 ATP synthase subunit b [Entomobacter blattae]
MLRIKVMPLPSIRRIAGLSFGILFLFAAATPSAYASGMPQLDIKNPLVWGQAIWVCIVFLALYLTLKYAALPKIETVLEHRKTTIKNNLEKAQNAKSQADASWSEVAKARSEAQAEAAKNVNQVMDQARKAQEQQKQDLHSRFNSELNLAEQRIQKARNKSLTSLPEVATETTAALLENLLGEKVDNSHLAERARILAQSYQA